MPAGRGCGAESRAQGGATSSGFILQPLSPRGQIPHPLYFAPRKASTPRGGRDPLRLSVSWGPRGGGGTAGVLRASCMTWAPQDQSQGEAGGSGGLDGDTRGVLHRGRLPGAGHCLPGAGESAPSGDPPPVPPPGAHGPPGAPPPPPRAGDRRRQVKSLLLMQ